MEKRISDLLIKEKNCVIFYKNTHGRKNNLSDYLALEFMETKDVMDNISNKEENIFPNVTAVNVLENFDELRVDLNRILNNSKWANESCIVIMDVEKENIELLKNFAAHHNVSMLLISEDDVISVPQVSNLEIDAEYIFENMKDKDFAEAVIKLSKAMTLLNESYKHVFYIVNNVIDI